jgi:hypothetical protein
MGFGASIFLIAAGAILKYGLERDSYGSWNLDAIGLIAMVVGIIGLAVSTLVWAPWRTRRTGVVEGGTTYVERDVPRDEVIHRY